MPFLSGHNFSLIFKNRLNVCGTASYPLKSVVSIKYHFSIYLGSMQAFITLKRISVTFTRLGGVQGGGELFTPLINLLEALMHKGHSG